ncbi:MAG: glycosyltransferase family 4 protein [Lachnospiraceae bacterium]|nr:glycosyltransferase family 4 protein [Lachnospiraceae bacterium]
MKILITTDLFTTSTNGVVTSVRNLRDELKNRGHDVRILTLSGDRDSYQDGDVYYVKSISIGSIYPDVRMPISYRNDLIRELIEWKPDVIHSQCEFFSFQFARRIAKLTGAPLIHTYHTLYEQYITYVLPSERFGNHMVRQLSRARLKSVKTIIAPTSKVEGALRGYGLDNEIQVVPSGIALEQHHCRLSEEERREKRQLLEIPEDHQVLLNLGRLGTEKNLEELLEFFSVALLHNQKLTFLIVGDGPDKDNLEHMAGNLGIGAHVIFAGMVEPSEVQEYYQLADVFVSASTSETQGLTYIEAAANGLPLLCRKDDCLTDVIQEGVNGYEYTSVEEFLNKLKLILENAEWRTSAGKHSIKIAETFDKSHFADTIEAIYESVKEDTMKEDIVIEENVD